MSAIGETATIRGDYSMAELDRLAMAAARRHGGAADQSDSYEAAWFAIVEELYAADETPTERDLIYAGVRGVQRLHAERNQAQGRSQRRGREFGSSPAFVTFWNDHLVTPSHEDGVVEKTALAQVLSTLSGEQYEVLAAAAVCENLTQAATALGMPYWKFIDRFYAVRAACRALWFEGEEAPPVGTPTEDACGSGHSKDVHARTGPTGHNYCAECQRLAKKRRRARGSS